MLEVALADFNPKRQE